MQHPVFKIGSHVKFQKTSCDTLDSLTGVVVNNLLSLAYQGCGATIIVLLDGEATYLGQRAIDISEHCLELVCPD